MAATPELTVAKLDLARLIDARLDQLQKPESPATHQDLARIALRQGCMAYQLLRLDPTLLPSCTRLSKEHCNSTQTRESQPNSARGVKSVPNTEARLRSTALGIQRTGEVPTFEHAARDNCVTLTVIAPAELAAVGGYQAILKYSATPLNVPLNRHLGTRIQGYLGVVPEYTAPKTVSQRASFDIKQRLYFVERSSEMAASSLREDNQDYSGGVVIALPHTTNCDQVAWQTSQLQFAEPRTLTRTDAAVYDTLLFWMASRARLFEVHAAAQASH
jgi:hypothetical protein